MYLYDLYASSKVEGAGHAPHKADLTPPTPAAACRERPRMYLLIQSHPVRNTGKPPPQERRTKPGMLGGMTRNMHFSAFWLSIQACAEISEPWFACIALVDEMMRSSDTMARHIKTAVHLRGHNAKLFLQLLQQVEQQPWDPLHYAQLHMCGKHSVI